MVLPLYALGFGRDPVDRWPSAYGLDEAKPTGYRRQLAWPLSTRCPSF